MPLTFLRIAEAFDILAYAPDDKASRTNNANNKATNFIKIPRIKDYLLVKETCWHKIVDIVEGTGFKTILLFGSIISFTGKF